jgi:tRNA pseudouridine55 synthase
VAIHCGKGFYVRSLARDLGVALGTGGHCATLRRTAVGPFTTRDAHRVEDLPAIILAADAPEGSPIVSLETALARLSPA